MKVPVIKIGNSKGLRLQKSILQKYGIKDEVELVIEEECIIIRTLKKSKRNWDSAFEQMHKNGDDKHLIDDVFEDEDWD